MGVDVNLPDIASVHKNGHYDLGFDINTAGNVIVLFADVLHDKILIADRHLSADSLPERYDGVFGWFSGKLG